MFLTSKKRVIDKARPLTTTFVSSFSLPSFLVPAFPTRTHSFSTTVSRPSYIGSAPISVPPDVKFTIQEPVLRRNGTSDLKKIEVEGPLGKISQPLPNFFRVVFDNASRKASITIEDQSVKQQRAMWGMMGAYLKNHVIGVSEGHTAILSLVGVGYRATVENSASTVSPQFEGQQFVNLKVGFSHPIELPVPKGVKASTPQPTRILLEGCEKIVVMQFAANIRKWRVPEPYKGKGIFVNGETIRLKAKKIK